MCSGTDYPAKTPSELTAVTLHFFATGDQFAHTVLWEAGVHLGTGIATIFDLLNPGAIVLGGEVARVAKSFLLKPLFHCFHERTFSSFRFELESAGLAPGRRSRRGGRSHCHRGKLLPEFL